MAARRQPSEATPKTTRRKPATTPSARENQLVSAAMDLAEKQIKEGTVSAQVLTHYLKLGSSREALEQAKIEKENELLLAKAEAIESQKRIEVMYESALNAMKSYAGEEMDLFDED